MNMNNLRKIHISTVLSFIFIVVFFMIFINSAEGIYEIDTDKTTNVNSYTKIMNYVLAILIIFNVIMIFISLLSLLYICFISTNMFTMRNLLLSLYPIILILWISSFDIGILNRYITAPINLLFNL